GSVVARYRPAGAGDLAYVALCGPVREGAVTGVGQGAGLLGGVYHPFQMYDDPTRPLRVEGFTLPPDVTLGRMRGRMDLRAVLACRHNLGAADFDAYYGKALSLIASRQAVRAFRLDLEPAAAR